MSELYYLSTDEKNAGGFLIYPYDRSYNFTWWQKKKAKNDKQRYKKGGCRAAVLFCLGTKKETVVFLEK